jgi:thioredoxin 1
MENSDKKVVLRDFWAIWCGPCKIMNPILEEIEKQYEGKITVEKHNMDEAQNQQLVEQYQVMAIPTYIIEKDGAVADQFVGAQHKKTLTDALDKALAN